MSFGGDEGASDVSDNALFTTPSGHTPITFLASTGDDGAPGGYPAYSPNVVAVGGTLLMGVLSISMGLDRIFWFIPYDPHSPPVHDLPFFRSWPELIYVGIVILIAIFVTASYANARTMMARIAPAERMTEFFGLFSLSGQATSFLATSSATLFTVWTASQRGGMIAVMLFLTLGLIGMLWVKEERAKAV